MCVSRTPPFTRKAMLGRMWHLRVKLLSSRGFTKSIQSTFITFQLRHCSFVAPSIQDGDGLFATNNSIENNTAYRVLRSLPEYRETFFDPKCVEVMSEFKPGILEFRDYVSLGRDFADTDFDAEKVESIISQKSTLTDDEIRALLYFTSLPRCLPNPKSPNFEKFWKSLDEECNSRSPTWTYNMKLSTAELWFVNRLHRYSSYHWNTIKKLFRKCEKLTKMEFIRFLFHLNLNRQLPQSINTYELEHCLSMHINELSAVEVCVAALALFKTETPVRNSDLLTKCIEIGISKASELDSVFVAALAKMGRLSGRGKTSPILYSFQEAFSSEIDRLSIAAAMHVAIIATRTQFFHKSLLVAVMQKVENDLPKARLKEIERLLLVLTMFNVQCDTFCHRVVEEMRSPRRTQEIDTFGRPLEAILFYISMRKIYPYDLISKVLDLNFLQKHYGKNIRSYQRELVCLDFTIGLECPDYKGNRLDSKIRKAVTRTNLLWLWPETKDKVSGYEHSIRMVAQHMRNLVGGAPFVYTCNILPQFHSAELVFFLDENCRPVKVPQSFIDIPNHEVKEVPTEMRGVTPHAVLVASVNSIVKNRERTLLGQVQLQIRQLKKMGYTVHLVFPEDIHSRPTETEEEKKRKQDYFYNIVFGESSKPRLQNKGSSAAVTL